MTKCLKKCGMLKFLSLSMGVTTSQIALILIGLSDSIMMGRESSEGLAAGTWVSSVYNLGLLFCMGMIIPIAIHIGRIKSKGSGKEQEKIAAGYFQTVMILSAAVILFILAAVRINSFIGRDETVLKIAGRYAWGIVPGILPWVLFYLIRNILLCRQKVKLTTMLSILSVALNICLNYVFIYGIGRFRGLGAFGCALATSITNWIIFLIALCLLKKDRTVFPEFKDIFAGTNEFTKEIWRLGLPTGIMFFSESLIFAVGNTLLAGINTEAVVAFGIAVSWLNLSYMFPVALSQVLTEPLAGYYTSGKKAEFKAMSRSSLFMVLFYNAAWIVAILLFRKEFINVIVGDNCTILIYTLAEQFLYITAVIIFVYNFIVVLSGILRGFGDVKTPLVMMFFMYWIIGVGGTMVLTYFIGAHGVLLGMLFGFSLTFIGIWQTYRRKIREELDD